MTEIPSGELIIEPLARAHDRSVFACGHEDLDRYLKKQAGQDVRRRIAQVFIARTEGSNHIIGFYTLSSLSIESRTLPVDVSRKLPRHPIPAALIGRLAVDRARHGKGLGKTLLADALARMVRASRLVAIHAAIVDAKDEQAAAWYERFGFRRFRARSLRLYLPLATAERLLTGEYGA